MTENVEPNRVGNTQRSRKKSLLLRVFFYNPIYTVALVTCVLAVLYWCFLASDRFVSEAHVMIQRTDLASGQEMNFSSVISRIGGNNSEQYQLQDYLLSVDMLNKLEATLKLREHYSSDKYDIISRMWSSSTPLEWFHRHYKSRVKVNVNGETGMLIIRAAAYTPEMAKAIAEKLVLEGELFMNRIAHDLAEVQVEFLEGQVAQLNERLLQARLKMIDFQNLNELASPQGTTENLIGIVSQLETSLAELQTALSMKQSYLVSASPDVVELKMQIAAIEKQINREKSRLASAQGNTLNKTLEEYQRLQMDAEFALDVYKTALTALERGRLDVVRTIKQITVIQRATDPQYPIEPRRLYNTFVFLLMTLLLAGVAQMLVTIIRDHQD